MKEMRRVVVNHLAAMKNGVPEFQTVEGYFHKWIEQMYYHQQAQSSGQIEQVPMLVIYALIEDLNGKMAIYPMEEIQFENNNFEEDIEVIEVI